MVLPSGCFGCCTVDSKVTISPECSKDYCGPSEGQQGLSEISESGPTVFGERGNRPNVCLEHSRCTGQAADDQTSPLLGVKLEVVKDGLTDAAVRLVLGVAAADCTDECKHSQVNGSMGQSSSTLTAERSGRAETDQEASVAGQDSVPWSAAASSSTGASQSAAAASSSGPAAANSPRSLVAAAAAGAAAAAAALHKASTAEDASAIPGSQPMLPVSAVDPRASGELFVWQRVLFAERLHELLAEEQGTGAAADQTPSLLLTVPSQPYAGQTSPSGFTACPPEGQSDPVEMLPSRSMSGYPSTARFSEASTYDKSLALTQQQSAGQHGSQQEQLRPVQLELLGECAEQLMLQENQTPRSHAAWLRQLHQEELEAAAARAAAAVAATEGCSRSSMHSWEGRAASTNPGLKPSPPGSYCAVASARSSSAGGVVTADGVAAEASTVAGGGSSLIAAARPGYSLSRRGSMPAAAPLAAGRRSSSTSVPGGGLLPGAKRQPRLTSLGGGYGSRSSSSMVDPRGGARGYGSSAGGAAAASKAGRTGITDKLLVQLGHAAAVVLSQQQNEAASSSSGLVAGLGDRAAGSTGGGGPELSTAQHSLGSLPAMDPCSSAAAGAFPAASASTAGGPVSWPLNSWLSSTTSADSAASLGTTRGPVAAAQAARSRVSSCSSAAAQLPTSRSSTCSIGPHGRALKDGEVLTATQKAGLLRQVSSALATGVTMDELLLCCENSGGYTATAADRLSQLQQQPGPRVSLLGPAQQGIQQQQRRYSMQSAVHGGDKRQAALKPGRHTWAGPSLDTLQETLSTPMQQDSMQAGAMQVPQQEGEAQLLDIMLASHANLQEEQNPAAACGADTANPPVGANYSSTADTVRAPEAAPQYAALVPEGAECTTAAQDPIVEEELLPMRADSPELMSPGRLAVRLSHQLSANTRPSSPGIGSCRLSNTSSFDGYPFLAAQFSTGQLSCSHSQAGMLFPLPEQQPSRGEAPAAICSFPLLSNATAGSSGAGAGVDSSGMEAPEGSSSRRDSNTSTSSCSSFTGSSCSMSPCSRKQQAAAQPPSLSIIGKVRPSTSGTGAVAVAGPCGLRPASSGPLMVHEQQPMLLTTSLGPGQWELDLGQVGPGEGAAGPISQPLGSEDSRGAEVAEVGPCGSIGSISASSSVADLHPAAGADAAAGVAIVEAATPGLDPSAAAAAAEGTVGLVSSPEGDTGPSGPAAALPSRGPSQSQSSKSSTWGGGTQDSCCSSPTDPSHAAARRGGAAGHMGYSSCAGTSDSVVTHRVLTYENVTTVVWRERQHAQPAELTADTDAQHAAGAEPLPAAPTGQGAARAVAVAAAGGADGGVECAAGADMGEHAAPVAAVTSLDSIPEDGEDPWAAQSGTELSADALEPVQAATDGSTGSSGQQGAVAAATAAATDATAPAAAADGTAEDATADDASTSPAVELARADCSSDDRAAEPETAVSGDTHSQSSEPDTAAPSASAAAAAAAVSSPAAATSPKASRSSQRSASLLGGKAGTRRSVSSLTVSSRELPAADDTAAASGSKSMPSSPGPSRKTAASIVTTAAPSVASPNHQDPAAVASRRYSKSSSGGSSSGGSNAGRSSGSKLLLAAAASRPGSPLKKLLVAAASAATGTAETATPSSSTKGGAPASKGSISIDTSRSSSRGHSITGSPVSSPKAGAAVAAVLPVGSPSGAGSSPAHRGLTVQTRLAGAAAGSNVGAASPTAASLSPSGRSKAPSSPGTAAGRASKLRSSWTGGTFRSSSSLTVEVPSSPGKTSMVRGSPAAAAAAGSLASAAGVVRSPGGHRTAPGGLSTGLSPQSSTASLGGLSAGPWSSSLHAQRSLSAFGRTLAAKSPTKAPQKQQQQQPLQSPKSPTKAPQQQQQSQSPKAPQRRQSAKQQQLQVDVSNGQKSEGLTCDTSAASSGNSSSAGSRCLSLSSSMKAGLQQAAAAVVQDVTGTAPGLPDPVAPAAAAAADTAVSSGSSVGSSGGSTPRSRQQQLQRLREVRQQQRKRSSAGGSLPVTPAASASAGILTDGILSQAESSIGSAAHALNRTADLSAEQEHGAAGAEDAAGYSEVMPASSAGSGGLPAAVLMPAVTASAMDAVSNGGIMMGSGLQEAVSGGLLCWPLELQASGLETYSEAAEGAGGAAAAGDGSQGCNAGVDGQPVVLPAMLPAGLQSHPVASSADAEAAVVEPAEAVTGLQEVASEAPLCWPLELQLSEQQTHSTAEDAAATSEGAASGGSAAAGLAVNLLLAEASSPEPQTLSWPLELQLSGQQTHSTSEDVAMQPAAANPSTEQSSSSGARGSMGGCIADPSWAQDSNASLGCSTAGAAEPAGAAGDMILPAQHSWGQDSSASLECTAAGSPEPAGAAGDMLLPAQPSWAQDSMGSEPSSCSVHWAAITMFVAPDRLPSLPADHSNEIPAAAPVDEAGAAAALAAVAAAADEVGHSCETTTAPGAAAVTAALAGVAAEVTASRPSSDGSSKELLQEVCSSYAAAQLQDVDSAADAGAAYTAIICAALSQPAANESSWASGADDGTMQSLKQKAEDVSTAPFGDSSSSYSSLAPASQGPGSNHGAPEGCFLNPDAADTTLATDSTSAAAEQSTPQLAGVAPAGLLILTTAAEDSTVEEAVADAAAANAAGVCSAAAAEPAEQAGPAAEAADKAAQPDPAEAAAAAAAETADVAQRQVHLAVLDEDTPDEAADALQGYTELSASHAEGRGIGCSASMPQPADAAVEGEVPAAGAAAAAAPALVGEVGGAELPDAAASSSGTGSSSSSSNRVSACDEGVAAADAGRIHMSSSGSRTSAGGVETAAAAAIPEAAAAATAPAGPPATCIEAADGDQLSPADAAAAAAETASEAAAAATLRAAAAAGAPGGGAGADNSCKEAPAPADAAPDSAGAAASGEPALCGAAAIEVAEDKPATAASAGAAASGEAALCGAAEDAEEAAGECPAADSAADRVLLQPSLQLSDAAEPHIEATEAAASLDDAMDSVAAAAAAVAAVAAVCPPAPAVDVEGTSEVVDSSASASTVPDDSVAAAPALLVGEGPADNEAAASGTTAPAGGAVESSAAHEPADSMAAEMAAAAAGCGEATGCRVDAQCELPAVSAGGASPGDNSAPVFGSSPSAGLVSFHLPELQAEASAALSDCSSFWAAVPARALLGSDASAYEAGAGGDPAAGLAGSLPAPELLQVGPLSHPLGSMSSMLGSEYSCDSLASAFSTANLLAEESSVLSTTAGRAGGMQGAGRHRLSSSSAGGYWQQQQQQQQGVVGVSGGSFTAGLPAWQASSLQMEPTQTIDEGETEGEEGDGEEEGQGSGGVLSEGGSSSTRLQGSSSEVVMASAALDAEHLAVAECQSAFEAGETARGSGSGSSASDIHHTCTAAQRCTDSVGAPSGVSAGWHAGAADPCTPCLDSTLPALPAEAPGSEGEGHLSDGGSPGSPDHTSSCIVSLRRTGDHWASRNSTMGGGVVSAAASEGGGWKLAAAAAQCSKHDLKAAAIGAGCWQHAAAADAAAAAAQCSKHDLEAAASGGGCWKHAAAADIPAVAAECSKHGLEAAGSSGSGGWKLAAAAAAECSGSELQAAALAREGWEGLPAWKLGASGAGCGEAELGDPAVAPRGSADSWQLSTACDEGEGEVQESQGHVEGGSRVTAGSRLGLELLQLPVQECAGEAAAAASGRLGAAQTVLAPRLGAGMLLSIPSPTGELRCIDGIGGSSSYKPRQLMTCPAGPAGLYRTGGLGGAEATGSGSLLHTAAPGASRFAGSIHAWDSAGSLSSNAPRARSTTPAAGVEGEGSHAAGACADGLTGILALVRQLQGNLAGLELDMQQLHGALHRRSSTADASLMVRRHQPQHHQDTP